MNFLRLIIRNIRYFKLQWLITIAGVLLGTTVITGALITGDSVNDNLKNIVHDRLGETRFALSSTSRYFRTELASEMKEKSGMKIIPLLRTKGVISDPGSDNILNQAEIIGIDDSFGTLWYDNEDSSPSDMPADDEIMISENVARYFDVTSGDFLVIRFPKEHFTPAEAPFSLQYETSGIRMKIKTVMTNFNGGRFSLDNKQSSPYSIFVSGKLLSSKMGIPGFSNTLLVACKDLAVTASSLDSLLKQTWKPEDAGLILSEPDSGLFQISSRRIFLEEPLSTIILESVPGASGILTYLVNGISFQGKITPYSFVTAMEPEMLPGNLRKGEIVINEWLAEDLHVGAGDQLNVNYWFIGPGHKLLDKQSQFIVRFVVPTENSSSGRALMPDFPGITKTGSCNEWEASTPVDLKKIRDKDEAYWKKFRGTPKAWILLTDGQRIWNNPFGNYTAFRSTSHQTEKLLREGIRKLDPVKLGLSFFPVFEEGLNTASASTDFGGLFLGLGSLIFISGLLFSGMMLSFFLSQRSSEVSLLKSMGFTKRNIWSLYFTETMVISLIGSLAGILTAILYSRLIVMGLSTIWNDVVNTSSLTVSIHPGSLIIGFFTGLCVNLLIFILTLVKQQKISLPSHYSQPKMWREKNMFRIRQVHWILVYSLFLGSVLIIVSEIISGNSFSVSGFFLSAMLFFSGSVMFISLLISGGKTSAKGKVLTVSGYIRKNLALNRSSSILTILLLALGTFTVMVTGLNRRSSGAGLNNASSGTGGFQLWMETTIPVVVNLNTDEGKKKTGLDNDLLLSTLRFIPLPHITGDDASCLNLNMVKSPALTGVPVRIFDSLQCFSFSGLASGIDSGHPWKILEQSSETGVINGFTDQEVLTWILHKEIGDTLHYFDEQGRALFIRLSGGLKNSIFQGKLLIDENALRRYFPSNVRVNDFLIQTKKEEPKEVIRLLSKRLTDYGALVIPTKEKFAQFTAVENTYLDIFILLGGLGLIIGTAGFLVMVKRNLRSREYEVGLYRSIGFSENLASRILSGEFLFLLLAGVGTGILAAIIGTLPSMVSSGTGQFLFSMIIMATVLFNGVFWIRFFIHRTLKKPSF